MFMKKFRHASLSGCELNRTVPKKEPALRRQRILWRMRVGDASAKPTSAVKVLEKSDFMTSRLVPAYPPKQACPSFFDPLKEKVNHLHFES
jgi:hypothetical protein